ncbi:hypothetical protein BCF59_0719 [Mycoplasmopsis mustelae]|uniref:Transmembrane protein n=1 Tax=Mycoplasmopsis mustelae TaxID=171289 RepID=A0A4R7UBU4_9BACT|nr:hypothetical protein [Mycoplasmopsis mustelae]TDV22870.1 hypothetical protein BCF59_0719 [Mycoplasmopsis mustelae]
MKSKIIENKRIYDDYSLHLASKSQSLWSVIYKYLLVVFFVIAMLVVLILLDRSIFPTQLLATDNANKPLTFLFDFENTELRQQNATIILRFSPLVFTFFYAVFKNFKNIETQKEKINKYLYFYILYFALALSCVILLFFFITTNQTKEIQSINNETGLVTTTQVATQKLITAVDANQLFYILIPLFLLNTSFEIYNHIYKRQSEPLLYGSVWHLLVQIFSHTALLIFCLTNIFIWISASDVKAHPNTFLFDGNWYWNKVENLFNQKTILNLSLIILFFVLVGLLIFGANIKKVFKIVESQITKNSSKDKYVLHLALLIMLLITFIKVMTIDVRNLTPTIGQKETYNYFYVLFIVVALIIVILYFVLVEFMYARNKNNTLLTIYMSLAQTLLWVLMMVSIFVIKNPSDYVYNTFSSVLLSVIIYIHYVKRVKTIKTWTSYMIIIAISLHSILLFLYALNHILIAQDNFLLVSTPTPISLLKIITIINFVFVALFYLSALSITFISLQKIDWLNKKSKE